MLGQLVAPATVRLKAGTAQSFTLEQHKAARRQELTKTQVGVSHAGADSTD